VGAPPDGFLYVANANYDRRYDTGTLAALRLGGVAGGRGLPAIESTGPSTDLGEIVDLGGDFRQLTIQNFAGEMSGFLLQDQPRPVVRLFTPSRAEGDLLEVVDADGLNLTCFVNGTNCINQALSLTALEGTSDGKPRAPEPAGVAVSSTGQLFVTHLRAADSPPKSNQNLQTFLVRTDAHLPGRQLVNPVFGRDDFISLGYASFNNARYAGPSVSSLAVGARFAYLSSRSIDSSGAMVFLFDQTSNPLSPCMNSVFGCISNASLEAGYRTLEARGVGLGIDETTGSERRLYVATRVPDRLIVASIANPTASAPAMAVTRAIEVPDGPNEVAVIPRARRGDLVVVTSSTAGAVSIYDDDLGRLVAQIVSVGSQPFGLAVQRMVNRNSGAEAARIFVGCFGDGRIGIIDVPNLGRPSEAWLIGYLGTSQ
jgi:hypothetical protein